MDGLMQTFIDYYGDPPEEIRSDSVPRTVDGAHWYEYFSRHHLIFLGYDQLLHSPNTYWGRIEFFKNSIPASFGSVIRSRFYSWYCDSCQTYHHRFTRHKILLADGSTRLHCEHDSVSPPVPHFPYDPHADANGPPVFSEAHLAEPVPGEGDPLVRFLITPCHACATNHWHALDSQGESHLTCYAQPLNLPIAVAASYRPHHTEYPIPGHDGGPGGLAAHSEDEGGNVDANDHGQPADGNAPNDDDGEPADGDGVEPANGNAPDDGDDGDEPADDDAPNDDGGEAADDNAAVHGNGHLADDNGANGPGMGV